MYARYKENPGVWRERIENILEAGKQKSGSGVRDVKIDIRSPGFWQESFEIIRDWQNKLTKLNE